MAEEHDLLKEEQLDIKYYIVKFLNYWYFFPIAIVIALAIAYYLNQSTPGIYKVSTSLLIRQEQSAFGLKSLTPENLFEGNTLEEQRIYNEIGILRSYGLIRKTLNELDFEVSYFVDHRFAHKELYHQSPFIFDFDTSYAQLAGARVQVTSIDKNRFEVFCEQDKAFLYSYEKESMIRLIEDVEFSDTLSLGEEINNEFIKGTFIQNPRSKRSMDPEETYFFRFNTYRQLVRKYHSFDVGTDDKSTILNISLETNNIEKGKKYLDQLIELYLKRTVSKKNEIANATLGFLNNQIQEISDSLKSSEKKLQIFRSSEQLMNMDILTEQTYAKLDQYQSERAEILVRQKYYDYLTNYLKKNKDVQELIAPTSMGIEDPLLMNLVNKLSDLYTEKTELEVNSKKENPYLNALKMKIEDLKSSLLETLENLKNKSQIRLSDIESRVNELTGKVKGLPAKQRLLFGYERRFELYNEIYTYLLKKRSETEVGKAANIPVHEVLDKARLKTLTPIKPRPRKNYLIALLMGIIVPAGLILLIDYFNDKITDINTIERMTDFPVLGHIIHNKHKAENVVFERTRSPLAEAFRSVRTNFQFITGKEDGSVILVSSASQGEGKSFVSLNIATAFALYEKKTVLVSFDLRRPNLYDIFNIDDKVGLSSYLSKNLQFEEIIHKTAISNLDIIPAGKIPPNPSELIASVRTGEFFERLKQEYDHIILDTPPVGLVTDAFLLVKYTDANLFVVRHNFTKRRMLNTLIKNIEQKKIQNVSLLVNDIKLKSRNYEYNYGYSYNFNYY